ncbi:E3 ubiquitin-protein ligase RFWD3 [Orussus abietinus]|uniref:E3 ubiquitin-protein ligase RFWD3 n=1 Tax=Orussus abietinus TaxID=222816 RepID=UPI0006255A9C|nr:E3 ubiquitin-protein ligase RFWD3 [Orussus abietinus]
MENIENNAEQLVVIIQESDSEHEIENQEEEVEEIRNDEPEVANSEQLVNANNEVLLLGGNEGPLPNDDGAEPIIISDEPIIINDGGLETTNHDEPVAGCSGEPAIKCNDENKENYSTSVKRQRDDDDTDPLDGRQCSICLDVWTNYGEHRLCSLSCGHVFGQHCIEQWLTGLKQKERRCPQCNQPASTREIRIIYAEKLVAVDTVELDVQKRNMNSIKRENEFMKAQLKRLETREKLLLDEINVFNSRIAKMEAQRSSLTAALDHHSSMNRFQICRVFKICKEKCSRVMDYDSRSMCVVASQKSSSLPFSKNGIRKVDINTLQLKEFVPLHDHSIRDICFQPKSSLLLSVGFDKCAKFLDLQSNTLIHTFKAQHQLWSCAWSNDDRTMFAGAQNGSILIFDIRQTSGPLQVLENPGDVTPVISLTSIPQASCNAVLRGGFLACQLHSCHVEESNGGNYNRHRLNLEGPFISGRYDQKTNHALISTRAGTLRKEGKHVVCNIDKASDGSKMCNVVYELNGGSSQQVLSRPSFIDLNGQMFVAAHRFSTGTIPLWNISTGKEIYNIPMSESIMDLCSFRISNELFLAALSPSKLNLYKYA